MTMSLTRSIGSKQTDWNYCAPSLTARRFALGGVPFTINFDLSHQDGSQTVRTRVGRIYNFSSAINLESEGNCLKCISQERAGVKASGSIPLTNIMIKKAQDPGCPLNSLLPDDSVNYLRDHLSWEVTDVCCSSLFVPSAQTSFGNVIRY